MSYLILIVSFVYAAFAVSNAIMHLVVTYTLVAWKKEVNFSFRHAVRYSGISFALLCLAIYVNHWPRR